MNLQSGEKRSYEVQMPIVIDKFHKENALKLFDAMQIAALKTHETQGDGQNMFYQVAKLLAEALIDTVVEKEPLIREKIKVKNANQIMKEKQEEDIQKQETNYQNALLDLTIQEGLEVELLTAHYASGEFGFNFIDDEVPNEEPEEDPNAD